MVEVLVIVNKGLVPVSFFPKKDVIIRQKTFYSAIVRFSVKLVNLIIIYTEITS